MTQADLVTAVFKIFNLYYQINSGQKVVSLFTRDDFFQTSVQNVLDISAYVDVESLDEQPLSASDIGKTYLTYATDTADYLLNNTDYLADVNGLQPDESTKLPFAPLGFLRVKLENGANTGYDLLPAIIPSTDSDDTSVVDDDTALTAAGSWVPRLLLYNGADWLRDYSPALLAFNPKVKMGRFIPPSGLFVFTGRYEYELYPPKLSFFDISSQPSYELVIDDSIRSFSLQKVVGDNIYTHQDSDFLQRVSSIAELDTVSLATNVDSAINPKGFFFQLYSNDLLIGNLSNYLLGVGRMNEALFQKLTGRQVLRIKSDLYLLDSITNYQLDADFASYKIYKFVANASLNATGGLQRYSSTQSYTATCPANSTGEPVTKTASATSFISQQEADSKALAAAQQLANFSIICTIPGGGTVQPGQEVSWTSIQYYVAKCLVDVGEYYQGNDVFETGEVKSFISQEDADTRALALAKQNAISKLVCTYSPPASDE
jgi:hypothetical protein